MSSKLALRWQKGFIFLGVAALLTMSSASNVRANEKQIITTAGIATAVGAYSDTAAELLNPEISAQQTGDTAGLLPDLMTQLAATETTGETETDTVSAPISHYGYENLGIAELDGNLNVRALASEDAEIVGKMPNHAACEVLGEENGWYNIQSGEITGYVLGEYLLTGDAAIALATELYGEDDDTLKVNVSKLNVRAEASTESEIIGELYDGDAVTVVNDLGEWYEISLDNGNGYVYAEYVSADNEIPTAMTPEEARFGTGVTDVRSSLVSFATQFVGNPYVWGGTSLTNGADCSGFVLSVYANYGIYLPHSSASQSGYGRRISASEAKPGDLFFYGRGGVGGIGHVAIYIGNGQVVHASTPGSGIIISSAYMMTPLAVTSLLD